MQTAMRSCSGGKKEGMFFSTWVDKMLSSNKLTARHLSVEIHVLAWLPDMPSPLEC